MKITDITTASLPADYQRTRSTTLDLCSTLKPEDTVVQSMPDVSPTKWHLAHVTWFFERFVLEAFDSDYRRLNDHYDFLFNSYYYSAGQMHARPKRGMLTRPTLGEIVDYRLHVDAALQSLLQQRGDEPEIRNRVVLGLNHEQQHQELLLTDIKHVFSRNPLMPAVNASLKTPESPPPDEYSFDNGASGIHKIGSAGDAFCFDNETPRHDALLHEHRIGSRLVTNSEFRDFIDAGGYRDSNLWLSDVPTMTALASRPSST
jgi:ergothioneine biosynthesis protein EgtB